MQKTLVLIKPDAVQRGLSGEIIARLERRGLKLAGMKMLHVTPELAHRHYGAHVDKPFFESLVSFITSSPLIAIAMEGENAVEVVRTTIGATNPVEATPRHDTRRLRADHRHEPDTRLRLARVGGDGAGAVLRGRRDNRLRAGHRRLDYRILTSSAASDHADSRL